MTLALVLVLLGQAPGVSLSRDWVLDETVAQPVTQYLTRAQADARYCKLTGCTMSGTLVVGSTATGIELKTNGFAYAAVGWFKAPSSGNAEGLRFESSNLAFYLNGASRMVLSGANGRLSTSLGGIDSAADVTAATFLKSTGVANASLPTCNAGQTGSLEYDTTNNRFAICDNANTGGSYGWGWPVNSVSGAVMNVAVSTSPAYFTASTPSVGPIGIGVATYRSSSGGLWGSTTAPTISSGFGTSPSVSTNNGTHAFVINVGTGGTASSGVIGLPAAGTGWNCYCEDITTFSTTVFRTRQTASSTTSCTVGNFNTSAAAAAWAASDNLRCIAMGY